MGKIGNAIIGTMIGAVPIVGGCGSELPMTASCDSTLYTNAFTQGYGGFPIGVSDNYRLGTMGFHIADGHDGGSGDTLEWEGCNNGVNLTWAYGELAWIG